MIEISNQFAGDNMNDSESRGRKCVLAVVFSSIIFLILHSTELPFQEYGNKLLLTLFRVLILAPLLIFLYKGFSWARITLAILCSILVTGGALAFIIIGAPWITPQNMIFIAVMMTCLIFNAMILFFSDSVKTYMRFQRH
jgi:hypothetical protein